MGFCGPGLFGLNVVAGGPRPWRWAPRHGGAEWAFGHLGVPARARSSGSRPRPLQRFGEHGPPPSATTRQQKRPGRAGSRTEARRPRPSARTRRKLRGAGEGLLRPPFSRDAAWTRRARARAPRSEGGRSGPRGRPWSGESPSPRRPPPARSALRRRRRRARRPAPAPARDADILGWVGERPSSLLALGKAEILPRRSARGRRWRQRGPSAERALWSALARAAFLETREGDDGDVVPHPRAARTRRA